MVLVKKYLVFTYYVGRSLGGVKDILDEPNRYYQVVDGETMQVVKEGLAVYKKFSGKGFKPRNPPSDEKK